MSRAPAWPLCLTLFALLAPAPVASAQQGKKLALLVGVTEYNAGNITTLKFTENDVEELAKILQDKKAGFDKVTLLTNKNGDKDDALKPTAANVRKHLKELLAGRGRHDVVWVGLAGHGIQAEVDDPEQKGPQKVFPMFCPYDADMAEKLDYNTGRAKTLINLNADLFDELAKCGAGVKLVLIDACREDVKAQGRNLATGNVNVPQGVGAMFSCTNGQRAFETPKLKHGVFFHFALEALRGAASNEQGEVTWGRLTEYVAKKVPEKLSDYVREGAKQTPHVYGNLVGASPVLLTVAARVREKVDPVEDRYREGMNRFLGLGESVDEAQAAKLFRASKDNPKAQAALAFMLFNGIGVVRDEDKAETLVSKALPQLERLADSDPDAANWLGLLLTHGVGTKVDHDRAFKYFEQAATAKTPDPDAMDNLGNAYLAGLGVKKDSAKAAEWYAKAVDLNLPSAMVHLGARYLNGDGVKKDEEEAFRLYKNAGDRAYPIGMRAVGRAYQRGQGVKKDLGESIKWLEKADQKGDLKGTLALADAYLNGRGVEPDRERAVELLEKAVAGLNAEAMEYLGRAYRDGRGGLKKNEAKAIRLLKKAVDQGDVVAMESLAELYSAKGTKADFEEALEWHQKAAKREHVPSMRAAGVMYLLGRGVAKPDGAEGVKWLEKAADKGDAVAAFNLGTVYERGLGGITANRKEALKWYRKAADAGHKDADAAFRRLSRST